MAKKYWLVSTAWRPPRESTFRFDNEVVAGSLAEWLAESKQLNGGDFSMLSATPISEAELKKLAVQL